jgi:hypothetical protein
LVHFEDFTEINEDGAFAVKGLSQEADLNKFDKNLQNYACESDAAGFKFFWGLR